MPNKTSQQKTPKTKKPRRTVIEKVSTESSERMTNQRGEKIVEEMGAMSLDHSKG